MIWGKSQGLDRPYPLELHLADTAAAAGALWKYHVTAGYRTWLCDRLDMTGDDTARFVALIAGLHDVGKAVPCFQQQRPAVGEHGHLGHATATYLTVPTLLAAPDQRRFTRSTAYRVGELLGGHHGTFPPPQPRAVASPTTRVVELGGDEWHQHRAEHVADLRALLDHPPFPGRVPAEVAAALAGLVVVADWVASSPEFVRHLQETAPNELNAHYRHVRELMPDRVGTLGLAAPKFAEHVTTRDVWGFDPNPLQASLSEDFQPDDAGLLTITADTGAGKTEAALLAAHRLGKVTGRGGVFFALPTMATTDEQHRRVRDYVHRVAPGSPVGLAHSLSRYREDYVQDSDIHEWMTPPRNSMLAGVTVGTVDQALAAVLATRHNMIRLHALAGKTLIVDEAHAYDPYMQALLRRLLAWCGHLGVPVVLLSATLPRHIHADLLGGYLSGAEVPVPHPNPAPYPGWSFASVGGHEQCSTAATVTAMQQRTGVTEGDRTRMLEHRPHAPSRSGRHRAIRPYLDHVRMSGGNVAIICNTVATAQDTYRAVRADLPADIPVWLLHSRFPQWQRDARTADVTGRFGKTGDRPDAGVVVATQVIEQSLDVDFDLLVSDLAPVALLLQRLGRCHRHTRGHRPAWCRTPAIVVLDPVNPNAAEPCPRAWSAIYPEYQLLTTHRVLAGRDPHLRVPDDVDALVQHVHHLTPPDMDDPDWDRWMAHYGTTREHGALGSNVAIPRPGHVSQLADLTSATGAETAITTRLGINSTRIIPVHTSSDGHEWLDAGHTIPFPDRRLNDRDVLDLLRCSITAPEHDTRTLPAAPHGWRRSPLADAALLHLPAAGGLALDPELGLIKE